MAYRRSGRDHNHRAGGAGPPLLQALLERLADVFVLPLDDCLRPAASRGLELRLPLISEHALADLLARLLQRHGLGRSNVFELEHLIAALRAHQLLTSPGFIASISLRSSGEMSLTLSGPISPAFAVDGESETSTGERLEVLAAGGHAGANELPLFPSPLRRPRR